MWITSMGNNGVAGVSQNAGVLVVLVLFFMLGLIMVKFIKCFSLVPGDNGLKNYTIMFPIIVGNPLFMFTSLMLNISDFMQIHVPISRNVSEREIMGS